MTSKEYLQQIATTEVIDCTYNDNSKKRIADIFSVGIAVIEKDLERLEKLEKVIEILKKALLLNAKEVRGSYYVLGYDTNYCMTKEEYELLKGELNNDNN